MIWAIVGASYLVCLLLCAALLGLNKRRGNDIIKQSEGTILVMTLWMAPLVMVLLLTGVVYSYVSDDWG